MKIGITGLANSGKSTIFNSLTGLGVATPAFAASGGEPVLGMAQVPDSRIDRLSEIFKPKKTIYSTVQFVDFLGLTKGDQKQNRSVCEFIKDADALVHVVRAFEDDSVVHPFGAGVDPVRDAGVVETEIMLGDLELIERRIENMQLAAKKGNKPNPAEEKVLLRCREALENETPLRDLDFSSDELMAIRHLQFMSLKPETVVVNIGEQDLGTARAEELTGAVKEYYKGKSSVMVLALSGKIEMEISELPADEAEAFLADLGITEPALNRLIRTSYENVGLIPFFTVGDDEVRSWAIRRGDDALAAAGKIHSDIQRGFIRAEVVAYEDFIKAGSLAAARDQGILRLEGKTYEVKDGDIINFRFNV